MKAVFADTFYWIALTNPGDTHSQEALRFEDLLSGGATLYATEEVLAEVLTFFAADSWFADPAVRLISQSHESFVLGFDLYAARPDKNYSLADCISITGRSH